MRQDGGGGGGGALPTFVPVTRSAKNARVRKKGNGGRIRIRRGKGLKRCARAPATHS